jgi:hypothetical protein
MVRMDDRYQALRRMLQESVWNGPGQTSPSLRQAAAAGRGVPAELAALVDKIHQHAYQVTDEEVAQLRQRYSDAELFEIFVSAATGAAAVRLEAGLAALEAAESGGADAAAKG